MDVVHEAEEESRVEMVVGRKEGTDPQAQSNGFITWLQRSFNELRTIWIFTRLSGSIITPLADWLWCVGLCHLQVNYVQFSP